MDNLNHPNRFRHSRHGIRAAFVSWLANNEWLKQLRRALTKYLPFPKLESDVTDVIYFTWMVEVDRVTSLVPQGTKLWQKSGLTPFSILTYRHGYFGPSIIGWFRRLFPSPLQSNWRLYLETAPEGAPHVRTVLFLKNVMNSELYSLGSRLFSDVLPTHLADHFSLERVDNGYQVQFDAGVGSAPKLKALAMISDNRELPHNFRGAFSTWDEAVSFLASQDAAIYDCQNIQKLAFSEIDLPVDLTTAEPLQIDSVSFKCPFVESLGAESAAVSFRLPKVKFRVLSERLL